MTLFRAWGHNGTNHEHSFRNGSEDDGETMPDIISRDAASRKSPQAENPALIAELRARSAAIEGAGPGGEGQGEG